MGTDAARDRSTSRASRPIWGWNLGGMSHWESKVQDEGQLTTIDQDLPFMLTSLPDWAGRRAPCLSRVDPPWHGWCNGASRASIHENGLTAFLASLMSGQSAAE